MTKSLYMDIRTFVEKKHVFDKHQAPLSASLSALVSCIEA